jgi:hypothetical protein
MADHTAAEMLAAVQAADAGSDSLIAYTVALKQKLTDALAHVMTPDIQAAINSVFDISTNEATKMAAAMNEPAAT